jgi:hypothetical protein
MIVAAFLPGERGTTVRAGWLYLPPGLFSLMSPQITKRNEWFAVAVMLPATRLAFFATT